MVVDLHKLIVQYGRRIATGCLQEGIQSFAWAIVHTVSPHDIQLVQTQVRLHSPQCLHL